MTASNIEELREALVHMVDMVCGKCSGRRICERGERTMCEEVQNAYTALDKPYRNCDTGTPEEQNERFLDSTEYDSYLKDGAIAAFRWGQKEYKAKQ